MSIVQTMTRLSPALALFSLLCGTLFFEPVAARDTPWRSLNAKRLEQEKHRQLNARVGNGASDARRATDKPAPSIVRHIAFSNPRASRAYSGVHALLIFLVSCAFRILREWRDPSARQLRCWSVVVGPDSYQRRGERDKKGEVVGKHHRQLRPGLIHFSVVFLVLSSGSGRKS